MDENHLGEKLGDVCDIEGEDVNQLSDVIEVIVEDMAGPLMCNGRAELQQPYVEISEQPASKALRFRYECEGRCAGSIPGINSSPENKTYPTIKVHNYRGRAVVVVSCVTKDEPHKPHPHNLVGREGCKKGVCTLQIKPEAMSISFSNLGIQCVKKKDIESSLRTREEIKVNPFMTGFSHRNQPTTIDLNAVRLCFQVFLEGEKPGKFTVPLKPVVSDPIFDKKAMCDLHISKMSHCNSYVDGSKHEIILLCEKVAKEDIKIRFFEEKDGHVVWDAAADFQPSQVHKQTAIAFRTPRYRALDITEPVKVFVQLVRPSDGACSEPYPFEILPRDADTGVLKRKRQKLQEPLRQSAVNLNFGNNFPYNIPMEGIKVEPRDKAPSPYGGHVYGGPSPNYMPQMSPAYPTTLSMMNPAVPMGVDLMNDQWAVAGPSTSVAQPIPQQEWNSDINSSEWLANIDSRELLKFNADNLSETFRQNVSINDNIVEDHSLSENIARLTSNVYDNMYGNESFKDPPPHY